MVTRKAMEEIMEFGREIEVNGVWPVWLKDDVQVMDVDRNPLSMTNGEIRSASAWGWYGVDAIRLPATHPAYIALDNGYEPWPGGDEAPADYDGGYVLLRDGDEYGQGNEWGHVNATSDIIGYHKRTQPVVDVEDGDSVTIKRMTKAEVISHCAKAGFDAYQAIKDLGLIREETAAERFTRETGFEVTDAVKAALEWERAK